MASFNRLFIGNLPPSRVGSRRKYAVQYNDNNNSSSHFKFATTMSSDMKSNFSRVYETLKYELLHDPSFVFDDDSRRWVEKMIDYNVPRGKMVRALSVFDSYRLFKEERQLTDNEVFLACALGWSIEWFQAYFCVHDDIMDGSHTRRGHSCWFRLPEVGMTAINDGVILRSHVSRILKKYFRKKDYYVHLQDLFNEIEFQTASGQMIEAIATHAGENDLSKYTLSLSRRICEYKTSYYTFYFPVACALLMCGENLDDHIQMKEILVEMGIYYQVQNDYYDAFQDPGVTGKAGTDIEELKCSWLVAKALELANKEQKKILNENYGIKDPTCVANVKELYHTLNLQGAYEEYENKTYEKLIKSIEAYPNKLVKAVLNSCLSKIYRKHKQVLFKVG